MANIEYNFKCIDTVKNKLFHHFFFKDMFNLGEIIPFNFYIKAYGKYTNSIIIIWTLIDF